MIVEINLYSGDLPYFSFIFEKLNIFIDFYKLEYFKARQDMEIIIDTSEIEDKDEIKLFKKECEEYLPYVCKFIFNDNTSLSLYYNCEKYYIEYDTEYVYISHELTKSEFTMASSSLDTCFLRFMENAIKYTEKYTYIQLCEYKGIVDVNLFNNSTIKYKADSWYYSHVLDGQSDLE